jgi:16S rRNA (guanine527-N7)-methyltransferase
MKPDFNSLLNEALEKNNLPLTDSAKQKLIHYLELMQTWNRVFNLTTITEPKEMVYLHLIDSLIVHPFLHGTRLLDVGSGAGLPGIPLAIAHPDQMWTLLDKNNKKTRFMTQAIAELGLTNAEAVHARCEDFHPDHCFDSILSRAFGTIRLFLESTAHLLCPKGRFIAMKGKYPHDEIKEVPTDFVLQESGQLDIKGINVERHVLCFETQRDATWEK